MKAPCPFFLALRLACLLSAVLALSAAQPAQAQSFKELFPESSRREGAGPKKDAAPDDAAFHEETEEEKLIDAFVLRHVRFASDWNPDPTALPQFTYQFRKALRMRCQLVEQPLELSDPEIFKWPFLWMHAHNSFKLTSTERDNLRNYLQQGGVLLADDCSSGGGGWFPSFRAELGKILPGQSFIDVTPDHPRFKRLFELSYPFRDTVLNTNDRVHQVLLIEDRIAIFLIHDDYGCQWEVSAPPTSANPLGSAMHGFKSEQRKACFEFSFNIILYLLTH